MSAGLHPHERALLRHGHLVEHVLHFGPGLVALVNDPKLVDGRVPQVHRARDVGPAARCEY